MQIEIQASRQFDYIAYLKTISPHVGAQWFADDDVRDKFVSGYHRPECASGGRLVGINVSYRE